MDKLITTGVGGFPLVLDDARWAFGQIASGNQGIYQALNNMLRGFGDNFIVQGCVEGGSAGAITLTEGWIVLAGELLKVDAQSAFNEATDSTFIKTSTLITTLASGVKTFQNAASASVYQENRGEISGAAGTLDYNGDRLEEIVKHAETLDSLSVAGTAVLNTKIIEIGDWDMDSDATVDVVHGVDATKIRTISVLIQRDDSVRFTPLDGNLATDGSATASQGVVIANLATVRLTRLAGGDYDDTLYDSTSFNRGWVTIKYID